MALSVFDLFKIGIGPSSSHTVGPMVAADRFVRGLAGDGLLDAVERISVELFGSLGATGKGHGSIPAVALGLMGERPDEVDPGLTPSRMEAIIGSGRLSLLGKHPIDFSLADDIILHRSRQARFHSNAMVFRALDRNGKVLAERTFYSIGGGFVVDETQISDDEDPVVVADPTPVRYPFRTGDELLAHADATGLRISDIVMANEMAWHTEAQVRSGLLHIWNVMQECIQAGINTTGVLPGGLKVRRRAPQLAEKLAASRDSNDPLAAMDRINLYAIAVNEQNAAGGRVVTAPTNGAAGIIPAVLQYYHDYVPGADDDGTVRFLLVAAGIGSIIKENASISGAEVGCQGEVGSACSMAAAGLTEVLGGTPWQVENAAEIGIEHNLGLTCDPVGGLVQIPCIERNAVGAVKAVTASRIALSGDGTHQVSLDKAVKTMRETGADMKDKYKETARGGLALNVVEC
ncbi:L-serine ammonia-lyase [Mycolicibacterium agri]|uniref:L-serine dehydratase n=1 Tax=Mycolicibacterium agri TaxID=36811 RepID=A0A2A7N239_MYCAG|nr:L-serine ammonia-lyase [Mycolicibacterium agri]PEG37956.1 L-serine ammonia-lyase [Mycolicibacterium agri]GFG55262.1 L-serine dehydratase [Mycolicibacterium agri]